MNDLEKKNCPNKRLKALPEAQSDCFANSEYFRDFEKCLKKYNLSEKQLSDFKNGFVGLVDSIINSYLEEYF